MSPPFFLIFVISANLSAVFWLFLEEVLGWRVVRYKWKLQQGGSMSKVSKVAVVRGEDVRESVHSAVNLAGGFSSRVKRGDHVLVKPNACLAIEKRGVMTNPEVVRAVIEEVRDVGAEPVVGESAIHGTSTREALEKSGIAKVCREEGVVLIDFDVCEKEEVTLQYGDQSLSTVVAKPVLQCKVISVPVMKTHAQTGVTLSLKNMKGCFPGDEKKKFHKWHLDKAIAAMNALIRPVWAVVDGTTAMEGLGPIAGDPVEMNAVVASADVVAADRVTSTLMGFSLEEVTHITCAHTLGVGNGDMTSIEVVGDLSSVRRAFKKPWIEAASFENVTVVNGDACSGCVTECMGYLLQNKEKLNVGELVVILGPRGMKKMKFRRGKEKILAFGNCVKEFDTDLIVEGCPPLGYEIGKVLKI